MKFSGDSGYPLRTWLLTPFEDDPPENTPEYHFNVAHKRTRSVIERCNGVLKMRFRCLLKHRTLHYKPAISCRIINSCVVLHNMCVEYNIQLPENDEPENNMDFGIIPNEGPCNDDRNNPVRRVNPELAAGRRARARLCQNVFQNN